jgi:hypothetical protein
MITMHIYIFDVEKSIFVTWMKLKKYRHTMIAPNSNLKIIYLVAALFLILPRSLLS